MQEADLKALKRFIANKKPHVVIVGTDSRDAAMIQQDIQALVTDLEKENQIAPIPVEVVDNELSEAFSTTKRAEVMDSVHVSLILIFFKYLIVG